MGSGPESAGDVLSLADNLQQGLERVQTRAVSQELQLETHQQNGDGPLLVSRANQPDGWLSWCPTWRNSNGACLEALTRGFGVVAELHTWWLRACARLFQVTHALGPA